MSIIFCSPVLTMNNTEESILFYNYCKELIEQYVVDASFITNIHQINCLMASRIDEKSIVVFFNNEEGSYSQELLEFISLCKESTCRIWPIAMENTSSCRKPPMIIEEYQSFDISCRKENRNPLNNNINAIAEILVRKIISQTLSPLYDDEVLYFISHRRIDGEKIASLLADKLKLLTRERNVYRDVVNVEVGDDAQKGIDENLKKSDVIIYLQTPLAAESDYINKELCYALVNSIPVLWINIDNADIKQLRIMPGDKPVLNYISKDFYDDAKLEQITDEIEDKCFQLMMNSSNQLFSYLQILRDLDKQRFYKLTLNSEHLYSYFVNYSSQTDDWLAKEIENKHYLQCFGRRPREKDWNNFITASENYDVTDSFLLSNFPFDSQKRHSDHVQEMSYDDYFYNFERKRMNSAISKGKRIILSGAFPDGDKIYQNSLMEALLVYSCEIIKNGYTLVFGAHPTFQELIFDIGRRYSFDIKSSIEMHMSKEYLKYYTEDSINYIKHNCTLYLSNTVDEMRKKMLSSKDVVAMICIGGKIKEDKSLQGVDVEVNIAREKKIPVILIGTVGGRSSEMAYENMSRSTWSELNDFDDDFNKQFFFNVNHKMMIKKLLRKLAGD